MKTFLTLILASICSLGLYAHTANLEFFVGTWRYENPQTGEVFILKLRKTSYLLTHATVPTDYVVGAYTFKRNGQIVTDCMDKFDSDIHIFRMPVRATDFVRDPDLLKPNRLEMSVLDFGKFAPNGDVKRAGFSELLIVSATEPHQIRWILREPRGPVFIFEGEEDGIHPLGFSIPTDIILTRVPPVQFEVRVSARPPTGGTVTGGGLYEAGTVVTISATADPRYEFVNWTGNATVNTLSHTFTINSNMSFTANFNPCMHPNFFAAHAAFQQQIINLSSKASENREYIVTFEPYWVPSPGILSIYERSSIGRHSAELSMPSQPIGAIARSHFDAQSYSVFTLGDLFEMYQLLINDKMGNPSSFFIGLVTAHGVAYRLSIGDVNKFRVFAEALFGGVSSRQEAEELSSTTFSTMGMDRASNTASALSGFLNFLKLADAGLLLFMSTEPNFNSWTMLSPNCPIEELINVRR